MRIALNAWFYDLPTTGSGQYVRNLVTVLREIAPAIDIQLVYPRSRGDLMKVLFEQGEFPHIAAQMHADIALVPYWAPPLHSKVRTVVTIHDVIPLVLPEYRGGPLQRAYTALVSAASQNVACIITDSEYSKHDIVHSLPVAEDKVHVVPLAADRCYTTAIPQEDVNRVNERYQLPSTYVFYLGNFDRRKNIETLLQTYVWAGGVVGEEYPLVIAGEPGTPVWATNGRAMALEQMMRELELDSSEVRLIGRVAEEDKAALYAGARCFLLPSTYEGFGLTVLEAMACGCPVVGSNASSIPEVVGDAGILVDPNDARRMAGAVIAICSEDELHDKLSQRAIQRAAQYSWQRTAYETLAVINQLVPAR